MLEANLVEPGKYLVLFAGGVAEVEEAFDEALEVGAAEVLDRLLLPMVHQDILPGLAGKVSCTDPDTIGIVETTTVSAGLLACDRALKDALVELAGLRITPGLGGKAFFVVHGSQHDVEAALEVAKERLEEQQLRQLELIPRPHEDFLAVILRPAPFSLGGS